MPASSLPAVRPPAALYWLLFLVAASYALLVGVNHYLFRTNAYDLGIYSQALWDYAHARVNVNSIMRYNNLLGDHFSPQVAFWAPLYWLLGSWTLLVVQAGAALLGGYGAYKLHLQRSGNQQPGAAVAVAGQFWACWGIWAALAFDYHDNVVAALLLPWVFYWFEQDRPVRAAAAFGLLLLSKESVALWLVFVALGLALGHWQRPPRRWLALGLAAGAAGYFGVVTKVVIPALSGHAAYLYEQRYAAVGGTFGQMLHTAFTRPFYVLGLLFGNHLPAADGDYVKLELHLMVLLSGGYALLRRPQYLLMLVPIYAQKLFSNEVMHWGLNYQYSVEFVPVISAALSQWLAAGAAPRRAGRLAVGAALLTLAATVVSWQVRRSPWYDKSTAQFYKARHFRREWPVAPVYAALAQVPPAAAVSASSAAVPHLAERPYVFMFPYVGTANYLLILPADNAYPLTPASLRRQVAHYRNSPTWQVLADHPQVLLLRRRQPLPAPARRYFARRATIAADTTVADASLVPAPLR